MLSLLVVPLLLAAAAAGPVADARPEPRAKPDAEPAGRNNWNWAFKPVLEIQDLRDGPYIQTANTATRQGSGVSFQPSSITPYLQRSGLIQEGDSVRPYIQRSGVDYLALPQVNVEMIDVNIVKHTRQTVNNAKAIMNSLKTDLQAAPLMAKVLNTLSCLNTVDDVIETLEDSARLIDDNGPELVYLTAIFQRLQGENDILVTIRTSAKMLRIMQVCIQCRFMENTKMLLGCRSCCRAWPPSP